MIEVKSSGSFSGMEKFLQNATKASNITPHLHRAGRAGVTALSKATPLESGETKNSWRYEVKGGKGNASIVWSNGHTEDGVPIAIILQYGHGTGTGGYVRGRDYINPAMRPIFDKIADDVWKAVTSA